MRIQLSIGLWTLLGVSLTGVYARAAGPNAPARNFTAVDLRQRTIYHSPQNPGYTCWVFAWVTPDGDILATFYQASGPVEGRERAPEGIQRKLSWPHLADPRRDMTGLKSSNVFLRSKDGGASWEKLSEDFFRTPINGVVNGAVGLRDGSTLRALFGPYLAYDSEIPGTGLLQRSFDGTKTWDKPVCFLPPDRISIRPAGLRELRDGRVALLGGVSRTPSGGAWEEYTQEMEPLLLVSPNGGRTWSEPIAVVPDQYRRGWACEECDALELANGDLFWVFRRCAPEDQAQPLSKRRHVQWQGVMEKCGDSWTPKWAKPTPFGNTGLPNLLATREGVILHAKTGHWTADQGESWHSLHLPDVGYYPKAVQWTDGRILLFAHIGSDDPYGAVDQSIVLTEFRLKAR
jgi:hypothetical protein